MTKYPVVILVLAPHLGTDNALLSSNKEDVQKVVLMDFIWSTSTSTM